MSLFSKAVKAQMRARVALCGPTGSGKTWTSLEWADVLADGGKVALIDTERGSASLYAHRFTFDTLRWEPPFDPRELVQALKAAQQEGYAVVVIDSLSHFWEGEGGTRDIVDAAGQRAQGNSFAGWKIGTPIQRHMVDTILGLDAHVIATMRSKMEYVLEEYTDSKSQKKTRPLKIGLAPVQRNDVEYEFTVVGEMDLEHRVVINKSRCDVLADQVVQPGRARDAAKVFFDWLNDGEPLAPRAVIDELTDALNAIADEEARKAAKVEFIERFGRPDALRESQVDDARALVASKVPYLPGSVVEDGAAGDGEVPAASSDAACATCALTGGQHEDGCPEAAA